MLVNDLLDKLITQSDNEYHDIFFTFDGEEARIGANRYVLSGSLNVYVYEVLTYIYTLFIFSLIIFFFFT